MKDGFSRVGIVLLLVLLVPGLGRATGSEDEILTGLSIEDLMRIRVRVASLKETSVLDTPSMVTVIDRDLIEQYNLQSVAEAVNLVAGMSVLRTYLKRDLPTARGVLQDHYANKVLLLINDVPTWMGVTGEGALQRIDIHDVERIEVLKGPASVLYGTNAFAGAINIILRDVANLRSPKETGSTIQIGIAEDLGFRAGGHYLSKIGGVGVFLSASTVDNNGHTLSFVDEEGEQGRVDQYSRTNTFTGKLGSQHHSVLVNAFNAEEDFFGVTPSFAAGAGNNHLLEGVLASYTYTTTVGPRTSVDAGLTYDWNLRDFSRSGDDTIRASIIGCRMQLFSKAVVELSSRLSLEGGLDLERRKSAEYRNYNRQTGQTLADNNMKDRGVSELSGFLQLGYTRPRLRLVVGSRYTDNQLFGNDVSSRATVVYRLGRSSSLKLNAGQSYRIPSLFELYFQTPTNTVWGNTDLVPEKNETFELAYSGSLGNLYLEALVYHAEYESKIFRTRRYPRFVDDPEDTSTIYINGGQFAANGVELSLRYQQSQGISSFLNYTYIDGNNGDEINGTGHYNFKYVPRHVGAGGLAVKLGHFQVSGVLTYQSKVGAPVRPIGSQTTVDLNFGYRHRHRAAVLRHYLSVKNLTDNEIEVPEYVRRRLNAVPAGYGRRVAYTMQIEF